MWHFLEGNAEYGGGRVNTDSITWLLLEIVWGLAGASVVVRWAHPISGTVHVQLVRNSLGLEVPVGLI